MFFSCTVSVQKKTPNNIASTIKTLFQRFHPSIIHLFEIKTFVEKRNPTQPTKLSPCRPSEFWRFQRQGWRIRRFEVLPGSGVKKLGVSVSNFGKKPWKFGFFATTFFFGKWAVSESHFRAVSQLDLCQQKWRKSSWSFVTDKTCR